MNEFLKTLLSLSLSGALLTLLILLLKKIYKNHLSKRWQYYIWLAAALRFLLPFAPDATIVGTMFQTIDIRSEKSAAVDTASASPQLLQKPNSPAEPQASQNQPGLAELQPGPERRHISLYFMIVWLVPALTILTRKIMSYRRFMQDIRTPGSEVSDPETLNLLATCEEACKVRKPVELYHRPHPFSPVMTGFFRPCIVIPDGKIPKKELSFIFTHELIHYKRRDMFYKWLIQAVVCVHWFNPFVYLLEKEVNHACELSCDEALLHSLTAEEKKAYGDTLLFCAKKAQISKTSVSSITLTEGAEQLKERLGAIMNYKISTRKTKLLTIIFTAAICLVSALAGAYTAPANTKPAKKQANSDISHQLPAKKQANNNISYQLPAKKQANNGISYQLPAAVKKVLTLKTYDYKDKTLTEFSEYISERYAADDSLWNARQQLPKYINEELKQNLSEEDYEFLTTTLPCTESESTDPHDRVGAIPPDFGSRFQIYSSRHRTTGSFEWTVRYQSATPDMTVRQRDDLIQNIKNGMEKFVKDTSDDTDPTTMQYLKKIRKHLDRLIKENSGSGLEMTVFQCLGDGKSA